MGNLLLPFTVGNHLPEDTEPPFKKPDVAEHSREYENDSDKIASIQSDEERKLLLPRTSGARRAGEINRIWHKIKNVWRPYDESTSTVIKQDGFISSLMFFLMWTACSFSFSLARFISKDQTRGVDPIAVELTQLVNMIVASVIMWMFSAYRKPWFSWMNGYILETPEERISSTSLPGSVSSTRDDRKGSAASAELISDHFIRRMRGILQNAIPLIGILLFYIGGMVMDIIKTVAHMECISVYRDHKCDIDVKLYSISILFHCFRIVYKGSLIVFIFKFHDKAFKQCTVIRYMLLFILSTVMIEWFNTLIFESRELLQVSDEIKKANCTPPHGKNGTRFSIAQFLVSDHKRNLTNCLREQTDLYTSEREIAPYIYPLHIEFAIMIGEILFHLYFSVRNEDSAQTQGVKENTMKPLSKEMSDVASNDIAVPVCYGSMGDTDCGHTDHDLPSPKHQRPNKKPTVTPTSAGEFMSVSVDLGATVGTTEVSINHTAAEATHHREGDHIADIKDNFEESTDLSWPGEDLLRNYGGPKLGPADNLRAVDSDTITELRCQAAVPTTNGLRKRRTADNPTQNPISTQKPTLPIRDGAKHIRPAGAGTGSPRGLPIVFAPMIVLSIMLFAFAILTTQDNDISENLQATLGDNCTISMHWRHNYENYKLFYHALMATMVIIGFIVCRKCTSRFQHYNGLEILIIFISFGLMLHIFLFLIAAFKFLKGTELRPTQSAVHIPCKPDVSNEYIYASIVGRFVLLLSLYMQTTFLLYAGRIKIPEVRRWSRVILKNCLVGLAIGNLAWWVTDSFAEIQNHELLPVQSYFYDGDKWNIISHILYPFTLFYRFNYFLLILGVYFDH